MIHREYDEYKKLISELAELSEADERYSAEVRTENRHYAIPYDSYRMTHTV